MSIRKKISILFCVLVFFILLANNIFHYIRSKSQLLNHNAKEISLITKEVSYLVKNTKSGTLYVEEILGRELRTASLVIKDQLPPDYHDVTNQQLKQLASEVGVSHITLLAKTKNDIIGVKSSDPAEINMSTKGWGYWYDAFQQLFALQPVMVGKGLTLPHYWSGPIEVASSNPDHTDKWGYYYDGTTNYIINPYLRDSEVLDYQRRFGPGKIIDEFKKEQGVLELSVFNPTNFGKKKEYVYLNGNKYIRISAQALWYGTYKYKNCDKDASLVKKAMQTKKVVSYTGQLNGKSVMKTFIPVYPTNDQPYVIGLVYDYGLIQDQLNEELLVHILISLAIMVIVLIVSLLFSRSISKPIGYIVEQVRDIAQGKFGKKLTFERDDELGVLTDHVNALSSYLDEFVTDLQQSKKLIEYQAYHDSLTGLRNRRYFQEAIEAHIHSNEVERVAILFIDLDRFKHINDNFGHNKGDDILKLVAQRIRESIPSDSGHLISRQGGDEFIIALKNVSLEDTMRTAKKLVNSLKKPFKLQGTDSYLGSSCGISFYPDHSKDLDSLIIYADIAMYAAKRKGGNKVVLYSNELNTSIIERHKLETRLRIAIESESLDVYYQPKVNGSTGNLVGVEALVRWTDEEMGYIPPDRFIPVAEETGLIQPLWEFVLKTACYQVSEWNRNRNVPLSVSVNFSSRQFQEPIMMVKYVKKVLRDSGLAPGNLEAEITESILLNHSSDVLDALKVLREMGIKISVDDFGTGYSSLSYLKTLPIDILKIDKSFLEDITEDVRNIEILEAIIRLGRGLRLEVIVEGVETEFHRDFLLSRNCELMQGYLFSQPLNKSDFVKYLQERS